MQELHLSAVSRRQQVLGGSTEKRKNDRLSLRWTVQLKSYASGRAWRGSTRDMSPSGFYCILSQSMEPGEQVECEIALPSFNVQARNEVAYLRCRARVVRVEQLASIPGFGVACRIDEYRVVHQIDFPRVLVTASGRSGGKAV